MATCSVYKPHHHPLISRQELDTLLIFQRLDRDWVREVHRHTSITKKGQSYVVFRNSNNDKLFSLEELRRFLDNSGICSDFLDRLQLRTDKHPVIASNKMINKAELQVGANKIARQEARAWVEEVMEENRVTEGS